MTPFLKLTPDVCRRMHRHIVLSRAVDKWLRVLARFERHLAENKVHYISPPPKADE